MIVKKRARKVPRRNEETKISKIFESSLNFLNPKITNNKKNKLSKQRNKLRKNKIKPKIPACNGSIKNKKITSRIKEKTKLLKITDNDFLIDIEPKYLIKAIKHYNNLIKFSNYQRPWLKLPIFANLSKITVSTFPRIGRGRKITFKYFFNGG